LERKGRDGAELLASVTGALQDQISSLREAREDQNLVIKSLQDQVSSLQAQRSPAPPLEDQALVVKSLQDQVASLQAQRSSPAPPLEDQALVVKSLQDQTDAMAPSSLLSSDCGVAEGDLLLGIPRGWTAEGTSEWSDAVRESGELSKLVAMAKPASPPNMRPDSSSSLGEKLAVLKLRARSWSAPPAAAEERAPPQERAAPETNSDDDSIPNMSSPLKTTTRLSVGDLTPAVPRGTPGKARRTPRTTARATPGKAARMTPSGRALSGRKAGGAPASGRKGRGKGGDGRVEV
ncbi:hypothetical protein TeGR_g4053, partial [Tetraparma gracilis]